MQLIDVIAAERKTAFKNRDKFTNMILTTLLSEAQIIGKNNGDRPTTDEECLKVITKFKKNASETLGFLKPEDNAYELIVDEIKIYEAYLPSLMSEDELSCVIKTYIKAFIGVCTMGSVMEFLSRTYKGQYDGKTASSLTRGLL